MQPDQIKVGGRYAVLKKDRYEVVEVVEAVVTYTVKPVLGKGARVRRCDADDIIFTEDELLARQGHRQISLLEHLDET